MQQTLKLDFLLLQRRRRGVRKKRSPYICCGLFLACVIMLPFSPCFRECCRFFGDNGLTLKVFFTKAAPFGVLWTLTNYLYLHAIKKINTTDVSVLFCCNKAFVFLLSWIVLRDRFMGVRVSDSLSMSPFFFLPLLPFLFPFPLSFSPSPHQPHQAVPHTDGQKSLQSRVTSFHASCPDACELLDPPISPSLLPSCICFQKRHNLLQSM